MTFSPSWRTSTVVALARQIRESRDYGILPILADALQDAGCDDPSLAALRDEGIVSPVAGLWLAGVRWDGLWERGQRFLRWRQLEDDDDSNPWERMNAKKLLEQLQRLHTGGKGERWDECPCPECPPEGKRHVVCAICLGTVDLLKFREEDIGPGGPHSWYDQPRPLSFDLGPLPVVSARVEEIAREERCESECPDCHGTKLLVTNPAPSARMARFCSMCQGRGVSTGRTWVPSEWMRSLPPWYDVTLEGVEPMEYEGKFGYPSGTVPMWVAQLLIDASGPNEFFKDSPAAARLELCRAIRHWRFTS